MRSVVKLVNMVRLYLAALWHQWRTLVMGGSLATVVAIWQFATARSVAFAPGAAIILTTFVATSFYAWREERERGDVPEGTLERRKESGRTCQSRILQH